MTKSFLRAERLAAKQPKTLANSFAYLASVGERTKFKLLHAAKAQAKKIRPNYNSPIVIYKLNINGEDEFRLGWNMPDAVDYKEKFVCHG